MLPLLGDLLPATGRALDLAGGTGRNALWLARRGLDVTLADFSAVALRVAREAADAEGLPLRTLETDLETEPAPVGPWDLVVCALFLHRPLLRALPGVLAPGGLLVVAHPTRRNLERHPKPGPGHLLDKGELAGLATGLRVVRSDEAWRADGRHEAWLVARKPTEAAAES